MVGFFILGIVLWIFIALWPARVASRKGYSFLLYFIISLFFWFITLFVVYSLKDKTETKAEKTED